MGGWFRHYKTTSKPTKLANGHFTHTIGPRATHRGHFCFTNMPTCKGRPVQSTLCSQLFRARTYISSTHNLPPYSEWEWRPTISAHHIMAFLNHYATYCLAILWHYTKRVHHIHLPQSLCRILPCYIMACESRVVVKVCGVMFCYLGITLQAKSTRRNFQVCLEGTLHSWKL